jgi:hypothetical protein
MRYSFASIIHARGDTNERKIPKERIMAGTPALGAELSSRTKEA